MLRCAQAIAREVQRERPPGARRTAEDSAQIVIADRERLGDRVFATFQATTDYLHQVLGRCGPADWDTPCYHPRGVIPVQTFLDLRVIELVMHGWDIRSRLESVAPLSPEGISVLMERLRKRLDTFSFGAFHLPAGQSAPVCYRFELRGTLPSSHDLIIANGRARLEPAGATRPQVTFQCETESFVLLLYRRVTLEAALAAGSVAVEGDPAFTRAFARWLMGG